MQHVTFAAPAGAARRFFRAFYQWTNILSFNHHKDGLPLKHTQRIITSRNRQCAFSTSRKLYKGDTVELAPQRNAETSISTPAETETTTSPADTDPPSAAPSGRGFVPVFGDSFDFSANIADGMRLLMRQMAHPVVVITTSAPPAEDSPPASTEPPTEPTSTTTPFPNLRAMTVSSFTTVTLSPDPIISFNVKVPSRTFSALTSRQVFRILILSGNAAGARVADAFTKGSPEAGFQALTDQGMHVAFQDKKPWAPTIRGPGILMALDCELLPAKCIDVGDHAVVLAKVVRIRPGQVEHKDADADAWINGQEATQRVRGLVYGNRAYRTIGPSIELSRHDEPLARKPGAQELTRMQDARNLVMAALRNDRVFEHMPRYTVYKLLRYAFGGIAVSEEPSKAKEPAQPHKVKAKEGGFRIRKHGSRAAVFRTIATGRPDEGPDVGGQARYREADVEEAEEVAEEGAETTTRGEAQQEEAQPTNWSFEDFEKDLPPEARFNFVEDEHGSEEAETAQAARNDDKSKELDRRPDRSSKVTREKQEWGSFGREAMG